MFNKARQQQQQESSQRRRVTLPPLTKAPSKPDLQTMMGEAQNSRGVLIEVQIRREQPPVFVLTCQWDQTASDPAWALYEGADGSKSLWSYPNSDLEMVFEMVSMSIPTAKVTGPLPTELAPPPAPVEPPKVPTGTMPAMQQPAGGYAQPGNPYGAPPQAYPQQQPPQPYPQQQAPYPQQQAPYPQQQPYPPQGYPPGYQGYPPQGAPQAPYPQQQQPYPQQQQAGYPPQPQAPYPQQHAAPPQGYPAAPGYSAPAPSATPIADNELKPTDLSGFVDLLNKGSSGNLLIGHLFVEAGVVPEPCLEAALKIQEHVRKGELSNAGAIEALRVSAEHGGVLTDDIVARARAMYPVGSPGSSGRPMQPGGPQSGPQDPREAARQVVYLIQQSGIVTENDIATAEGVRRKHGGDVGNILVAAGKIEKATLDAARRCQPLVREHKLNQDECARILQHCQKNKSSVEDASRELGIRPL